MIDIERYGNIDCATLLPIVILPVGNRWYCVVKAMTKVVRWRVQKMILYNNLETYYSASLNGKVFFQTHKGLRMLLCCVWVLLIKPQDLLTCREHTERECNKVWKQ